MRWVAGMRRDHQESEEIEGGARDRASEDPAGARHSDAPYRDRRDALVQRRRAVAQEHADAERAVERREKLARHLEVIDSELREATAPILESLEMTRSCRGRWEEMAGDDTTRRCRRCGGEVHDLTRMTRDEVHALFARAERTPGMALRRRADGRVVTSQCKASQGTVSQCTVEPPGVATRAMHVVAAGVLFGVSAAAGASIAMAPMFSGGHVLARDAAVRDASATTALLPTPRVVARRAVPAVRVAALANHQPPVPASGHGPITTAEVDAHVRWIAPQAWEIDRVLVERALSSTSLAGMPLLIPSPRAQGAPGLRAYGVRRDSALARLGIANGDTLLDVNGYPLGEPDRVLEAYTRLRGSDTLFVRLERRGEERVHVYRIVE